MCYIKEGMEVTLNEWFQAAHPSAPYFVGQTATIQRVTNQDNSGYIILCKGFRYQCQAKEFTVKTMFKQCRHDYRWEFTVSGTRAAVHYADILDLNFQLDYGQFDVPQWRDVRADLFPPMRNKEAHDAFVATREHMFFPKEFKRSIRAHL